MRHGCRNSAATHRCTTANCNYSVQQSRAVDETLNRLTKDCGDSHVHKSIDHPQQHDYNHEKHCRAKVPGNLPPIVTGSVVDLFALRTRRAAQVIKRNIACTADRTLGCVYRSHRFSLGGATGYMRLVSHIQHSLRRSGSYRTKMLSEASFRNAPQQNGSRERRT